MLNRGTPDQISKTYILSYFHYVEFLLRSNRKMEGKKQERALRFVYDDYFNLYSYLLQKPTTMS